jgi:hypothetical protein
VFSRVAAWTSSSTEGMGLHTALAEGGRQHWPGEPGFVPGIAGKAPYDGLTPDNLLLS